MTELRRARRIRRMTGLEVGRKIGISSTNLYRYESRARKLPVEIAKRLGALYGVPWESFYEDDDDGQAS